ncbi:hypothetical protein PybrP1_005489 [[Pythium] brassicae (nom. inval.)]|nr:hypothetical protein PybrP1_005489 [[Pythium] brassicae (nom. inval.)]
MVEDTCICHIYKIVCFKSNDIYVGSTFSALRTRLSQHKRALNNGCGVAIYPTSKQREIAHKRAIEREKAERKATPDMSDDEMFGFKMRYYKERTRIYHEYESPYKLPSGTNQFMKLEEYPIIGISGMNFADPKSWIQID